jgi:hypothetical protein
MEYKLAKELDEAGFPQLKGKSFVSRVSGYRIPTLEELIEACVEKGQLSLNYHGQGKWIARIGYFIESTPDQKMKGYPQMAQHCVVEASTPTEAVARLWLALNKKV